MYLEHGLQSWNDLFFFSCRLRTNLSWDRMPEYLTNSLFALWRFKLGQLLKNDTGTLLTVPRNCEGHPLDKNLKNGTKFKVFCVGVRV